MSRRCWPSHDTIEVVSGPVGRERVHFQAPRATRLDFEMQRFLDWFATTGLDPVLKAGVGGGGRSTSYRIAGGSERGGSPASGLPRRKSTSD